MERCSYCGHYSAGVEHVTTDGRRPEAHYKCNVCALRWIEDMDGNIIETKVDPMRLGLYGCMRE